MGNDLEGNQDRCQIIVKPDLESFLDHSYVLVYQDLEQRRIKIEKYGGKYLKPHKPKWAIKAKEEAYLNYT